MRLKDQVAIVTGAARGLGQEFCIALAREGARIVAADIQDLTDTTTKVEELEGEILGVHTDVALSTSVEGMVDQTLERFGHIDILVNNAAILPKFTPFTQIDETSWDRIMGVNAKGVWLCCKAVVPKMRDQGRGKIVNISSDTIFMGVPMLLPYVASKGAIFALTRALSRELAGSGITVNCVTPGFTLTEGVQAMADAATISHIRSLVLEQQIVKRGQERADVTGALLFLVSSESDFITGQTINVDGGAIHY